MTTAPSKAATEDVSWRIAPLWPSLDTLDCPRYSPPGAWTKWARPPAHSPPPAEHTGPGIATSVAGRAAKTRPSSQLSSLDPREIAVKAHGDYHLKMNSRFSSGYTEK